MMKRRNFAKQIATATVATSIMPNYVWAQEKSVKNKIWAVLIPLSNNMWEDHIPAEDVYLNDYTTCKEAWAWAHPYRPFLTFDQLAWDILLLEMAAVGLNMVVMDLGDGIHYQSHPEIAVEYAWKPDKLKKELAKMRKLGLEPIPKLNFSASHDAWLGKYSRMVSTEKYYSVCSNLINEVIELLDHPRFFHLGMDEETAHHQRKLDYIVIRQNNLWWKDLYFYIDEIERLDVRPWVWSDYGWNHPELFFKKMPKTVIQSNWYYGSKWDWRSKVDIKEKDSRWRTYVKMYNDLEEHGYDQIPTGSNHSNDQNIEATANFCRDIIDSSRLMGFMAAPWRPTLMPCIESQKEAIAQMSRVIKSFK